MTAPGGKGQNSIDLGGVRISTEKYRKTRDEVAKPAVKGIEKQLETEFFPGVTKGALQPGGRYRWEKAVHKGVSGKGLSFPFRKTVPVKTGTRPMGTEESNCNN
jgi:hypothetical protein